MQLLVVECSDHLSDTITEADDCALGKTRFTDFYEVMNCMQEEEVAGFCRDTGLFSVKINGVPLSIIPIPTSIMRRGG